MFKRGNVWWTCLMVEGHRVQRSLETTNKKLAEKIEAKLKLDIAEGKFFERGLGHEKTFADLAKRYLTDVSCTKAKTTHIRDEGIFRKYLVPIFGEILLANIRRRHVVDYKVKRRADNASGSTINKELNLMKAAFNVAIKEWEWLDNNPVSKIRMEKVTPGRVKYLSSKERKLLYCCCSEWLLPMFLVARYTGMRQGNLLNLRWGDVDLFRKVIILDKTKNGERLGIPICRKLYMVLLRIRKTKHFESSLVFHNPDGSKIYREKLRREFRDACKKAGIKDFRWHDLRHDFASELVQKGVSLYVVQQLLGHRDGRMTKRYAHLAPENLRYAVENLDELSGYSNMEFR